MDFNDKINIFNKDYLEIKNAIKKAVNKKKIKYSNWVRWQFKYNNNNKWELCGKNYTKL